MYYFICSLVHDDLLIKLLTFRAFTTIKICCSSIQFFVSVIINQMGSLSHWNVSGNWNVHEGGYGTEKAFVSSYMHCVKYQEVDLTEYFSPEYLDTAPEIQVCVALAFSVTLQLHTCRHM